MKLKLDFITNSSSTSYIVYVPNDLNIEKFLYLAEDYNDVTAKQFGTTTKKLKQKIKKQVDILLESGIIDDEYIYDQPIGKLGFIVIDQVLRKLDLIITGWDVSSEGNNKLININTKECDDKIKVIKSIVWPNYNILKYRRS